MKTVVVVPVYTERATVMDVLDKLLSLDGVVDELVVVEDGSNDGSDQLISEWSKGKAVVTLIRHERNRGYSEALLTGFRHVLRELDQEKLSPSDVVATVDADGQHDPSELPKFLEALDLDVVWARRDLSVYPRWKRLGNQLMALIASVLAGFPFKDVESGYCLFRLGALREALRFQRSDSRYSLSLTLAVVLARLGYRISNEPVALIKVYRSRTRPIDVALDTWAAITACTRVTRARVIEHPARAAQPALAGLVLVALGLTMVLIATKPIYLGHDSINNYAHVWYISKNLFKGSLPLHFENLEGGQALTYPYGFVSWTLAALAFPILGDYAVTWTMILGVGLVLLVVYRTRLKSNPWLLVLFGLIPFFSEALLSFQMSFVWGMLFGYLYAWALQRRSYRLAYLWLLLGAGNHILIMGPILGLYSLYVYWQHREMRRPLLKLGVLAALPLGALAWYTLKTPAVGYNDPKSIAFIALSTIAPRAIGFFSPFTLTWLAEHRYGLGRWLTGPVVAGCLLTLTIVWHSRFTGYSGLIEGATNDYLGYLESASFIPGAVYRVAERPQHEQGQYFFIQRGAILSSEFFAESTFLQNWTVPAYRCFLAAKRVDFVVLRNDYLRSLHRNEGQVLEELRGQGLVQRVYEDSEGRFVVYGVRGAHSPQGNLGVKQCMKL